MRFCNVAQVSTGASAASCPSRTALVSHDLLKVAGLTVWSFFSLAFKGSDPVLSFNHAGTPTPYRTL